MVFQFCVFILRFEKNRVFGNRITINRTADTVSFWNADDTDFQAQIFTNFKKNDSKIS